MNKKPYWENLGFKTHYEYEKSLMKKKGLSPMEYANISSQNRGFFSSTEEKKHLAKQRGFESLYDYQKHLAKQRGFESTHDYEKHLAKEKLCKSLQKLTSNVKDPESLFSDIEFIRNITGCKIPTKKKSLNIKKD